MAYIPGQGFKKPMNMMENPVYPDIRKGPPQFQWSKKSNVVHAGDIMRESGNMPQFIEGAVLIQPRDYNENVYGKSSHKTIVNAEFRPPIQRPYEDFYSLTRVPCTSHAIEGRINPSTVTDAGTNGFKAMNNNNSDVTKHLTDRIKTADIHRTYFHPLVLPLEQPVLPDVEMNLPTYSVSAGYNYDLKVSAPQPEIELNYNRLTPILDTGFNAPIKMDNHLEQQQLTPLGPKTPTYSVTSGYAAPFTTMPQVEEITLEKTLPSYSVSAGGNVIPLTPIEDIHYDLGRNLPSYAVTAGFDTFYQQTDNVSQFTDTDKAISDKMDVFTPLTVINPGSESSYKDYTNGLTPINTSDHLQERIKVALSAQPESQYRERNILTKKHFMRKKLDIQKTYGQVEQTGGSYTRTAGVGVPTNFGPQYMGIKPKKAIYSF